MTTQNWPDPKRPGVPMFPERKGWHVIDARSGGNTVLAYWNGKEWSAGDCVRGLNSSPEWWRYNGAVLSATQINGMLAAERERCAEACSALGQQEAGKPARQETAYLCAANIRNLGDAT